ncbi:hypothetical protein [Sinorhizobium fredii]|uniref:hypothetical protein n=1 Tax=Rhizobium fredii TaxID=380 RepID=UPI0005602704|nr:hypothetical protein [Sinorhizobium fredii]
MSFTKELLFGDDPRYDKDREQLCEQTAPKVKQFPFRIRGKRKEADGKWSLHWDSAVKEAADQLGIHFIPVNSRFAFRTERDQKAVEERAETIWKQEVEAHRKWLESVRKAR